MKLAEFKGLGSDEVSSRVKKYGKNVLAESHKVSILELYISQFKSPFVFILLIVSFISLLASNVSDAFVIFIILCINAAVGAYQERRANNAMAALRKMTKTISKVVRGGLLTRVQSEDVTVGDIVYLEPGDIVPADGSILDLQSLSINESQISGESVPVQKNKGDKLFRGSIVSSGTGFFEVATIGVDTFIGKISKDISEHSQKKSQLEIKIAKFSKLLLILLAVVGIMFVVISVQRGVHIIDSLKTAVALGVAVIPEGLPVVVTVVLSIGALRISRAKALLKNLQSGSTLSSVSYICTDKTGTLTRGELIVKKVTPLSGDFSAEEVNDFLYHSLDFKNFNGEKVGDLLEIAIEEYLARSFSYEITKEVPFTSEAKFNAREFIYKGSYVQVYKGAAESLGVDNELVTEASKDGYRVIVLAYKISKSEQEFGAVGLKPLAMVVFEDKVREEAGSAITACKKASISVMMITGDSKETALHVAKEVGILTKEEDNVFLGSEIERMSDSELKSLVSSIKVIARANPLHKERVVQALQSKGEIVAMTGDGVNDGPALSLANIGIAMGKTGTEVAKEASDLVLVNDDFSDIIVAIFEARVISENIRKTIVFLMSSALAIVVSVILSLLFSVAVPFTAIQILLINFVAVGFLDVALATEEGEMVYSKYTHTRYKENILNMFDIGKVFVSGLWIGLVTFFFYLVSMVAVSDFAGVFDGYTEFPGTVALFVLCVSVWFNAFSVRSNYRSVFLINPFKNKFLIVAVVAEFCVLLLSIYHPVGQSMFDTVPLSQKIVTTLTLAAASIFFIDTIYKVLYVGKSSALALVRRLLKN